MSENPGEDLGDGGLIEEAFRAFEAGKISQTYALLELGATLLRDSLERNTEKLHEMFNHVRDVPRDAIADQIQRNESGAMTYREFIVGPASTLEGEMVGLYTPKSLDH